MNEKNKKRFAMLCLLILILAMLGISFMLLQPSDEPPGPLTLDDLLSSHSERTVSNVTVITSGETPYFNLIGTPVALYYDNERQVNMAPLLEAKPDPSDAVTRFVKQYEPDNVIAFGDPGMASLGVDPNMNFDGKSPELVSKAVASQLWTHSDGVILVKANCQNAYNIAVPTVPLASYVNIPVIVTSSVDKNLKDDLKDLGVKYSIVCGDLEPYGKKTLELNGDAKHFSSDVETIQDLTRGFIEHPDGFGEKINYITMANPLDITQPEIDDITNFQFQDEIYHHASSSPGVWPGTTGVESGKDFYFKIPNDYNIALIEFYLKFKPHDPADQSGERMYAFVYDSDGNQEAFFGTPCGKIEDDYRSVKFDLMLLNKSGEHKIHIQGSECWEGIPIQHISEQPVKFDLTVDIQTLNSVIRPLMPDLSSLAPYLTAYHKGLILANPEFSLHRPEYTGCIDCDEPTLSVEAIEDANKQALFVHSELLSLLARLANQEPEDVLGNAEALNSMADLYYSDPVYLGIIADTNMIPHYYYYPETGGSESEGWGEPGDTLYADVNADPNDPLYDLGPGRVHPDKPDLELAVGRLSGFDAQDVSVLLSRTFFYYDIIDKFSGFDQGEVHTTWKNNAYAFLGSAIPVELMYGTLFDHIKESLVEGGFSVKETSETLSHRENSDKFQTGSNYIVGGVHGFYYWYVPAVRTKYAGGSAFDVAHVREMNFGPSTMFLVSCVTGRIDGLNPENCLATAYIHAGVNAYVGATRSTYGGITSDFDLDMRLEPTGAVLLSKYFTEQIMANKDVGISLRDAKNLYLPDDSEGGAEAGLAGLMFGHYIIHGDPAFNPYEPANEG